MNLQGLELEHRRTRESVSIIVPCFNESEGIESLEKKLLPVLAKLRSTRSVELICIDDGSIDDTFIKLEQAFSQQAKIIRHPENKGLSAAIRTGFSHSTGNIICTIDSDCTYDPEYLIYLLDLMQGDVDIATASPYHPKGRVKNVPGWRLFLSKGLSQIYRLVLPQKLYTYTSMFRAYRREVMETIQVTYPGFLGLVEIVAEAMLCGYKVAEYPTELTNRVYGQSKLRVARVVRSHLQYIGKLIIRQFLQKKNGRLMQYKYTKNNL
ncbi:glycosyltransferase family 2 protein [Aetokthonos hydrillicola Thurmond2011]|uniref:Glycosyltransferase family 2 protein n=1 Tax=Aetokthonos hydrillicola Thurmond2011 TaxID=2712845 RepID=A0AAP5ICU4_9CYAN|nr:glycosyltransferase family 2 protein [Aetokthonos hydrillicola]MBO3463430.1 glycosyltransferase family 2 protein [Aetokthonos hydrillicola CCALA 1050]MBW4585694.1 glycosyltransferase family 2 protein [Aetokthonos hydrillicola CCALA 1050]MDR9899198.1 glycosyltransferase family 2 protein [Aetokthonos hydrillicola Thurmond2011]